MKCGTEWELSVLWNFPYFQTQAVSLFKDCINSGRWLRDLIIANGCMQPIDAKTANLNDNVFVWMLEGVMC